MRFQKLIIGVVVVGILLVAGYFSMNAYIQKVAKERVDSWIQNEHLQNRLTYASIKSNLLGRRIVLTDVRYTVKGRYKKRLTGYFLIKRLVLSGNWKDHYVVNSYNATLYGKIASEQQEVPIVHIEHATFDTTKQRGFVKHMSVQINQIRFDESLIKQLQKGDLKKIVKLDEPINVHFEFSADFKKKELDIKRYRLDFKNNVVFSYSLFLRNVDFDRIGELSKEYRRNPKDITFVAQLVDQFMKIKPALLNLEFVNQGLVTRAVDYLARKEGKTPKEVVDSLLSPLKSLPIPSAYPSVERFLLSKADKLKLTARNVRCLKLEELIRWIEKTHKPFEVIELKLSN